jgi:hypothetical protein
VIKTCKYTKDIDIGSVARNTAEVMILCEGKYSSDSNINNSGVAATFF